MTEEAKKRKRQAGPTTLDPKATYNFTPAGELSGAHALTRMHDDLDEIERLLAGVENPGLRMTMRQKLRAFRGWLKPRP